MQPSSCRSFSAPFAQLTAAQNQILFSYKLYIYIYILLLPCATTQLVRKANCGWIHRNTAITSFGPDHLGIMSGPNCSTYVLQDCAGDVVYSVQCGQAAITTKDILVQTCPFPPSVSLKSVIFDRPSKQFRVRGRGGGSNWVCRYYCVQICIGWLIDAQVVQLQYIMHLLQQSHFAESLSRLLSASRYAVNIMLYCKILKTPAWSSMTMQHSWDNLYTTSSTSQQTHKPVSVLYYWRYHFQLVGSTSQDAKYPVQGALFRDEGWH